MPKIIETSSMTFSVKPRTEYDPNRPAYDTKEGVAKALTSYPDFLTLIAERREAGYTREEDLNILIILIILQGAFQLDSCGNCFESSYGGFKKQLPETPLVFTHDEFSAYIAEHSAVLPKGFMWNCEPQFPAVTEVCAECQKGWTLENLHDRVPYREEESMVFYHRECNKARVLKLATERFQELFTKAGFISITMEAIPNEYWPDEYALPWFTVTTEHGTIKIGWRKRVINIELIKFNKRLNFMKLFQDEDVTKGNKMIHAWGWDKAQEYLTKIYKS